MAVHYFRLSDDLSSVMNGGDWTCLVPQFVLIPKPKITENCIVQILTASNDKAGQEYVARTNYERNITFIQFISLV
jgi:hypothetical protein